MALSDKEDKLFIGGFETEIRIFSTIDGSLLKVLPNSKQGSATLLKMTSDEKTLISVSSKRNIKIYNLETSECHMFRHTHSCTIVYL
jgi:WD40 repeat protein